MRFNKLLATFVIASMTISPITAKAFTPHTVENTDKVLLYWGDINKNISNSTIEENFDGTIKGTQRTLIVSPINFENNDQVVHRDSRANNGKLELKSNIQNGVDGVLLLLSNKETSLEVNLNKLGNQTINISDLKLNDFTHTDGNFILKAKFLGNDFLETPLNPDSSDSFNDTPSGEWFFKYVQRIKNRQVQGNPIFEGYKNTDGSLTGIFGPADNITLGQMMKVVLRVSGYDENNSNLDEKIKDLNHWSTGFLNTGIDLNLSVMTDASIDPSRLVTRGEFFQTLVEAQGLFSGSYDCPLTGFEFKDLSLNHPNTKATCALVRDGVISGTDSGYLNLNNNINRAEVAKILNTALDIYVEQPSNIEDLIQAINDLSEDSNNTSGGSNSGGTTGGTAPTAQSFIPTATLAQDFLSYSASAQINFTDATLVREDHVSFNLTYLEDNSDKTSDIVTTFNNNNENLTVNLNTQWGVGKYKLTLTDDTLSESKEFNFEILNCGNDDGFQCPSSIQPFVRYASLDDTYVGYTDPIIITFPNGSDVRTSDIEYTLIKKDGNVDQTNDLNPSFTNSNATLNIRQFTQWDSGEYTLTIEDSGIKESKVFNFEILNCGEEAGFECPGGNPFITKSSILNNQFGYTSSLQIQFDEPENVRTDDITVIVQRVESNQGGVDYYDIDTLTPTFNSETGVLSIRQSTQWGTGFYEVQLQDTAFNQNTTFTFEVTDQP